ncbi:hypothetical protein SAMN04488104_11031 [Algoriphagus faecimaris]|uniref:Uncharacterized protein n=1 Tax=Algoriphagus faecimaris TaxID=686796 RepID=A0A1G6YDX8_9BACT|nr:hypothetical protein [Algoriphagus faecimaris]SDD88568.1 hypothetical protein SAMN04488104_11031 [Algoriphagus faecimaris]
MFKKRCVIYPKDVQIITGRTLRHGQKTLCKIRKLVNKEPHQYVTVAEFSEFSGIPVDQLWDYLI